MSADWTIKQMVSSNASKLGHLGIALSSPPAHNCFPTKALNLSAKRVPSEYHLLGGVALYVKGDSCNVLQHT